MIHCQISAGLHMVRERWCMGLSSCNFVCYSEILPLTHTPVPQHMSFNRTLLEQHKDNPMVEYPALYPPPLRVRLAHSLVCAAPTFFSCIYTGGALHYMHRRFHVAKKKIKNKNLRSHCQIGSCKKLMFLIFYSCFICV